MQVARHEFDGLARADQQRGVGLEIAEDLFGQAHRREGHRDRAAADGGVGAHLFGDVEGVLEQPAQRPPDGTRAAGGAEGVLDLAEDLRLAEDQRIQAARHAQDVAHALVVFMDVGVRADGVGLQPVEVAQPDDQLFRIETVQSAVEFGAVAGRDDGGLTDGRTGQQVFERFIDAVGGEGDLFTNLDRRGFMIDPKGNYRHCDLL